MEELRTVTGFFDNVAEAQQAVQQLLGSGFLPETISLATRADVADEMNGVGRFLSDLFGNRTQHDEAARPFSPDANGPPNGAGITVLVGSIVDSDRVTDLLYEAGAARVNHRFDKPASGPPPASAAFSTLKAIIARFRLLRNWQPSYT